MDLMLLTLFGVRAAGSIQIRSNRIATKGMHKKGGIEFICEMETADGVGAMERGKSIYIYIRQFYAHCTHDEQ